MLLAAAALLGAGLAAPSEPSARVATRRDVPTLQLAFAGWRPGPGGNMWVESEVTGFLDFKGSTSDGAQLEATLTAQAGGDPVIDLKFAVERGGFFEELPLPHDLLPGRFVLRLTGSSNGFALPAVERTLNFGRPDGGIVRVVDVSSSANGPLLGPGDVLPLGTKEIWVRFHFLLRPQTTCTRVRENVAVKVVKGKRTWRTRLVTTCKPPITVTWYNPAGERVVPPVEKKNAATVTAYLRSSVPLGPGTWQAVLRVGGPHAVVKRALIPIG